MIEVDFLRQEVQLYKLFVPETRFLADLASTRAIGYGVTLRTFASEPPHVAPQALAHDFHSSGDFNGLSYLPRVDPSGTSRSIALFDVSGVKDWDSTAGEVDDALIAYLRLHCRVAVVDRPLAAEISIL